ncbi:hypothetical protein KR222_007691 [Zaprionus bogoriensis]|nr:hypothetical protein KR222_007691 [Zaprionus bogoriensis]
MGDVIEALFISCMNNERASCTVQDLRTGTDLMRYKGGGTMQHHGLQMLGAHFVIAANSTKPLLHVWPLNGQEQMSTIRYVVPGKVNALALTPDGAYLVAGIQETIYLWHLNTGRLLNTLSKHYQPITCIRFSDRGEHFVTAGKDGAVLVWNLTQCVVPCASGDSDENAPLYSFNDHGLAVTDVHLGQGGIRAFMYTVSLDRCCKVYDLSNGSLLLSVVFPVALHSVVVNRLETCVYVGTGEGQVLIFHLQQAPRMKEYHLEEEQSQALVGHTAGAAVTCLALSVNGGQLISGGEDKQVCIFDVSSRQLIKTITQLGAITNLQLRLISGTKFHPGPKEPKFFADSLKRMISPEEENYCIELLVTQEYSKARQPPRPQLDYSCVGRRKTDAESDAAAEEEEDVEMADAGELEQLRAENARLKLEAKRLAALKADAIVTNPRNSGKKKAKKQSKLG